MNILDTPVSNGSTRLATIRPGSENIVINEDLRVIPGEYDLRASPGPNDIIDHVGIPTIDALYTAYIDIVAVIPGKRDSTSLET